MLKISTFIYLPKNPHVVRAGFCHTARSVLLWLHGVTLGLKLLAHTGCGRNSFLYYLQSKGQATWKIISGPIKLAKTPAAGKKKLRTTHILNHSSNLNGQPATTTLLSPEELCPSETLCSTCLLFYLDKIHWERAAERFLFGLWVTRGEGKKKKAKKTSRKCLVPSRGKPN